MQHVLDNPAFNALSTGNKAISLGNNGIKFFPAEVSPFVGFDVVTPRKFAELYEMIPAGRFLAFISPGEIMIPGEWKVVQQMKVLQMVFEGTPPAETPDEQHQPLTDEHIPAMLALTKQTNPGPFFQRTIDFGHYKGIFAGEDLVSMAGQRMNPTPYAEISAVCTHPNHLGKGLAKQLLNYQVRRIIAAGEIPFLHALSTNTSAIGLYEKLGFVKRHEFTFYAITKN